MRAQTSLWLKVKNSPWWCKVGGVLVLLVLLPALWITKRVVIPDEVSLDHSPLVDALMVADTVTVNGIAKFDRGKLKIADATGLSVQVDTDTDVSFDISISPHAIDHGDKVALKPEIKNFKVRFSKPVEIETSGVATRISQLGTSEGGLKAELQLNLLKIVYLNTLNRMFSRDTPNATSPVFSLLKEIRLTAASLSLRHGAKLSIPLGDLVMGEHGLLTLSGVLIEPVARTAKGSFAIALPLVDGTTLPAMDGRIDIRQGALTLSGSYERNPTFEAFHTKSAGASLELADAEFKPIRGGEIHVEASSFTISTAEWKKSFPSGKSSISGIGAGDISARVSDISIGNGSISANKVTAAGVNVAITEDRLAVRFPNGLAVADGRIEQKLSGDSSLACSGLEFSVGDFEVQKFEGTSFALTQAQFAPKSVRLTIGKRTVSADFSAPAIVKVGGAQPLRLIVNGTQPVFNWPVRITAIAPNVSLVDADKKLQLHNVQFDVSVDQKPVPGITGSLKTTVTGASIITELNKAVKDAGLGAFGPINNISGAGISGDITVVADLDYNATEKQNVDLALKMTSPIGVALTGDSLKESKLRLKATLDAFTASATFAERLVSQEATLTLHNETEVVVHKTNVGPFHNGLWVYIKPFTVSAALKYQIRFEDDGSISLIPKSVRRVDAGTLNVVKLDIAQCPDAYGSFDHIDQAKLSFSGHIDIPLAPDPSFSGEIQNPILKEFDKIKDKPIKISN